MRATMYSAEAPRRMPTARRWKRPARQREPASRQRRLCRRLRGPQQRRPVRRQPDGLLRRGARHRRAGGPVLGYDQSRVEVFQRRKHHRGQRQRGPLQPVFDLSRHERRADRRRGGRRHLLARATRHGERHGLQPLRGAALRQDFKFRRT